MSESPRKEFAVPNPKRPKIDEGITPTKAYNNMDFLNSRAARSIRIMCEFEETRERLRANNIEGTILVFGSARSLSKGDFEREKNKLLKSIETAEDESARKKLHEKLDRLNKSQWMSDYCDQAEVLSKRLTEWTMSEGVRRGNVLRVGPKLRYLAEDKSNPETEEDVPQRYVLCTGGGPGVMEAANKGASQVPGAKTMGMGISLPFEKGLNPYVTPSLAFEFHYFFTRKFWMIYQAMCIIVFPGGFGTLDELFEACTLKQSGRLHNDAPIVLMGKEYWEKIINWKKMVSLGTLSEKEYSDILFTDSIEEAYNHVVSTLSKKE